MSAVVLPELKWKKSPNTSSRGGSPIDLVVLHETAGSYKSAVSWLCNPVADASSTLVLREDGLEATQLVRMVDKPWTQGHHWNPRCLSIELANITAKGYANDYQLRVAARIAAWFCWQEDLPPRWARHGAGRGLTYHGDLPNNSGGHPNCGPNAYGWHRFVELVGDELDRGGFKTVWAR